MLSKEEKNQSWAVKETRDSSPLPPGSSSQSIVHTLIFLFKSLEVPLALDCIKDCTLFPAPGTQFQRCKLCWRHFYTLNINIRSQKEYQVEQVWCITDSLSGKGSVRDLISVVCTESMTSNSVNAKSKHATNSFLHLFTHIFKH